MWNNFSRCPALISLCGNSSLVPNCGSRRTQPEHTAEQKGNNWSLPCPAHRFILTFIIMMCFTEGDCMISFRHFMSAAPWFEPSHYLPRLCTCFFPFYTVSDSEHDFYQATDTAYGVRKPWLQPVETNSFWVLHSQLKFLSHFKFWFCHEDVESD